MVRFTAPPAAHRAPLVFMPGALAPEAEEARTAEGARPADEGGGTGATVEPEGAVELGEAVEPRPAVTRRGSTPDASSATFVTEPSAPPGSARAMRPAVQ